MKNWLFVIFAITTLLLYQNCSGVHETIEGNSGLGSSTSFDGIDLAKSLVAYEGTLFPITQDANNCVRCHSTDQQPLHSIPDLNISHDIMFSFGLVDLRDPPNSKIVLKISGGHQGFPVSLATDMQDAIQDWSDELVANGGLILADPNIVQPTYFSLFTHVFEPKCISCHTEGGEHPAIDYSDYATTRNTGQIVLNNAAASGLYIHTASGQEPKDGPALSAAEITAIAAWINSGALNN